MNLGAFSCWTQIGPEYTWVQFPAVTEMTSFVGTRGKATDDIFEIVSIVTSLFGTLSLEIDFIKFLSLIC